MALLLFMGIAAASAAPGPLPRLQIIPNSVSVSGVSSGGAMAIQMAVAWSSRVVGCGAIAAPPYFCASANVGVAVTSCMNQPWLINVEYLRQAAETYALQGRVDALSNLNTTALYLESGRLDTVVVQGVVEKTNDWFGHYIPSNLTTFVTSLPAEHCWPTDGPDSLHACSHLGEPYVNNCQYDASGALLKHIYGSLSPKASMSDASLLAFDQTVYGGSSSVSMYPEGYVYIPEPCRSKPCRLHIAFHGCKQDIPSIGDVFYRQVGLNEWAESNHIVVLYPQVQATAVLNPQACWDWWGYLGDLDYATKKGRQMEVLRNMIKAISGEDW